MKILSLFDGMACGMIAMLNAGIEVESYDAYEIDKYAIKVSSHNFPNIKHHGDVFQADFTQYEGVDFLVGGSPCTYWSITQKNNRETEASGMGWELFSQYVRAVKEAKPRFFIYENNKSMSAAIRESIDRAFGFEAVCINSALVSAQNRQRLYWVGMRNEDGTYSKVPVDQPMDRGIVLRDILEPHVHEQVYEMASVATAPVGVTRDGKAHTIKAQYYKNGIANFISNGGFAATAVAEPIRLGDIGSTSQAHRVYSCDGKSVTINAGGGGQGGKTGLYATPICHTIPQEVRVRKYSCDIVKFQTLLRQSKQESKLANWHIAEKLDRPQTEVEHWFRTDKYFNIPDEDVWFDLKKLLKIESTEFDDFVTVFEEREGVFEKANRCYDVNGKMSTLMTGKTDNIIAPTNINGERVYEVRNGMITIKGKQYPIKLADGFYIIRKLTVRECMRLQTVPEWYDFSVISNAQAYKCLGNGWTCEVITHLINATQIVARRKWLDDLLGDCL